MFLSVDTILLRSWDAQGWYGNHMIGEESK